MNRESSRSEFFGVVGRTLGSCQLVEEVLKTYIKESLLLARKRGETVSSAQLDSLAEAPLGPLIKKFGAFCGEDSLTERLRAFKDERNIVAHRAVTQCLDPDGELSSPEHEEMRAKLDEVSSTAQTLFEDVHWELNGVRAQLDFDDLTKTDD